MDSLSAAADALQHVSYQCVARAVYAVYSSSSSSSRQVKEDVGEGSSKSGAASLPSTGPWTSLPSLAAPSASLAAPSASLFGSSSSSSSQPLLSTIGSGERRELSFRGITNSEIDSLLWDYRTVFTAGTASLISTAASFPFDSLKSRLQVKYYPSIWSCARAVAREEGVGGFFRGVTIPLITISFVRTSSFSIYVNTKEALHQRGLVKDKTKLRDVALSGMAGGATSGVIISCGSAPFELVKVQRQLEYLTAVQKGLIGSNAGGQGATASSNSNSSTTSPSSSSRRPPHLSPAGKYKPQSGFAAASDILRNHGGLRGFYIGFPLHLTRDTLGTALYFGSYDMIRALRTNRFENGVVPGVPSALVSFLSGSTAGILSWLLVYPVDLLKTNVQQRTLSNHPQQLTGYQLFTHLLRERPPPEGEAVSRDTLVRRFLRLYRGLGVSALRSFISHGLTWALIESLSDRIETRTGKKMREM